ncbi:MAG: preprotein translocase subunit YajC [Hamadaea sp.]|nr:preprotein translocase subunit YajC [Hamadaea sp.]
MAALMYFMIIRPQSKRRKEAMELQRNVSVGDEVVTVVGLHAKVAGVEDDIISLEIAPGVVARYERATVARVIKAPAEETPAETTEAETPQVIEQGR